MSEETRLARAHLKRAARRLAEEQITRDAYEEAHPYTCTRTVYGGWGGNGK